MDRAERGRPIDILFVGSEPADLRATPATLRTDGITNAVDVVASVPEALEYLHRRGDYAEVRRPDVLLLDHDTAGGTSVELREATAPVGEDGPVQIVGLHTESCPDGGADGSNHRCLEKPVDGVEFIDVVVGLQDVWVRIVTGPRRE